MKITLYCMSSCNLSCAWLLWESHVHWDISQLDKVFLGKIFWKNFKKHMFNISSCTTKECWQTKYGEIQWIWMIPWKKALVFVCEITIANQILWWCCNEQHCNDEVMMYVMMMRYLASRLLNFIVYWDIHFLFDLIMKCPTRDR